MADELTRVGPGDVLTASRYVVEIDGEEYGSFSDVSGVSMEIPAAEQRVAVGNGHVELLSYPTNPSYGEITLKIGRATTMLFDWIQGIADNKFDGNMRDGVIKEYRDAGKVVGMWDIIGAWPTKWEFGEMKAAANTVRLESLTLNVVKITPSK